MTPTLEYKKSIGVGENAWGYPIRFPEVTQFSELFEDWRVWEHQKSTGFPVVEGVTDYCAAHRTTLEGSLHVKARPYLVKFINENMIKTDNYSWFFELTQRDDGMLVSVKNNAILASRWLALLNVDTCIAEIRENL